MTSHSAMENARLPNSVTLVMVGVISQTYRVINLTGHERRVEHIHLILDHQLTIQLVQEMVSDSTIIFVFFFVEV